MKNYLYYFLLTLIMVMPFWSAAQPFVKDEPSAEKYRLPSPEILSFSVDTIAINAMTVKSKYPQPEQAGVTIALNNSEIIKKAKWSKIDNHHYVWRVAFEVPNAKALNIYFRHFGLNPDDKLFIYSGDLKQHLGAFTKNNNGNFFATGLVNGNHLIVEYNSTVKRQKLPFEFLELGVVVQDERGFGGAGSCEVPVNCDEGLEWKHQKRSVARVLVKESSGLFWCTGTLVNTTRNDGTPYFLTANHCGQNSSASDYNMWVFDFDYESPTCERPSTEPDKHTFTGSHLVAHGTTPRSTNSDFKLLLLNDSIPVSYGMYFSGWDRSGDIPQHGVVIQHPQGDIKFISTYDAPAVSSFYYGQENPDGPFWKVTWSETENGYGVTEGGSSGSPLFNEDKLIVGTLTGGNAACNNNTEPDYFGKFSESWDHNGTTASTQLKPWLDPDNTGVMSLEGHFKGVDQVVANFVGHTTKVISGNYIEFSNLSEGNINKYRWEFEGGEPDVVTKKEPGLIYYEQPGTYKVKLTVSSVNGSDSLVRNDYINVIGHIFPNPVINDNANYQVVHILTGDTPLDDAEVYISDIMGNGVQKLIPEIGDKEIKIKTYNLPAGTYIISTIIRNKKTNYKLVVINNQRN